MPSSTLCVDEASSSTGSHRRRASMHRIPRRAWNESGVHVMPSDRQAQVRVRDLYKSFVRGTEEIRVLQKLTLEVPEGEFLALMGPSGSGKTTLLNLIAGLDTPTGGDIWVGEEHVSELSESEL